MVLFSEGFVLFQNESINSVRKTSSRVLDALKLLADTASRSSVVIYTLDPRGLLTPEMVLASDDDTVSSRFPNGYSPGDISDQSFRRERNFS